MTKSATKPSAKQKPSAKDTKKVEKKESKPPGLLTGKQAKVLGILVKGPKTRKELAAITNSKKGWSALLGAPSKGSENGMEAKGWIKPEGRPITVTITVAGKKIYAKHQKVAA